MIVPTLTQAFFQSLRCACGACRLDKNRLLNEVSSWRPSAHPSSPSNLCNLSMVSLWRHSPAFSWAEMICDPQDSHRSHCWVPFSTLAAPALSIIAWSTRHCRRNSKTPTGIAVTQPKIKAFVVMIVVFKKGNYGTGIAAFSKSSEYLPQPRCKGRAFARAFFSKAQHVTGLPFLSSVGAVLITLYDRWFCLRLLPLCFICADIIAYSPVIALY